MKRLLITNDDGIDAKGLRAAIDAFKDIFEIYVAAPMCQKSGYAHAATYFSRDNTAQRRSLPDVKEAWAVDGTPADCVFYAIHAFHMRPDFVLSGINHGSNLSLDTIYSGTVGAALEALINGVPAAALSLVSETSHEFHTAAAYGKLLLGYYADHPALHDCILNINVPDLPAGQIKGIRVAELDEMRDYVKIVTSENTDRDTVSLHCESWVDAETIQNREGDAYLIEQGYVTVTPLGLNSTVRKTLARLADDFNKFGHIDV